MFRLLLSIVCLIAFCLPIDTMAGAPGKAPHFWGDLRPGKYDVGLRRLNISDPARREVRGEARKLELIIWYPAAPAKKAKHVSFGDYFSRGATNLEKTEQLERLSIAVSGKKLIAPAVLSEILNTEMMMRAKLAASSRSSSGVHAMTRTWHRVF